MRRGEAGKEGRRPGEERQGKREGGQVRRGRERGKEVRRYIDICTWCRIMQQLTLRSWCSCGCHSYRRSCTHGSARPIGILKLLLRILITHSLTRGRGGEGRGGEGRGGEGRGGEGRGGEGGGGKEK